MKKVCCVLYRIREMGASQEKDEESGSSTISMSTTKASVRVEKKSS